MSDRPDTPGAPPPPPPGDAPPPAPPPGPPPAAPPPASPPPGGSQNTLMLVLSYLWVLALIPLLTEKDDPEVQWHAKNGLVLFAAEIVLWVVLIVLGTLESAIGLFGCLTGMLSLLIWLGVVILHVVAIVKAVGGGRLVVPGISQYADRF